MSEVHLQLLGRFQVRRGGEEIAPAVFGGRKVRALVRVLAVRRPDLVPHEVLAEALWPDRLPADPAANLGVLVNRARRALGDTGLVVTGSGGYALGDCTVDATQFLAALDRARAAGDDHAATLRACAAAMALWGEPLAEDTYAPWAREPRERLHRARTEGCERASGAALALGDPHAAAGWAADAVAADPLRESATLALARSLAAAGDPAGALARLAELRTRLADELGIDPSAEVADLQLALLRGEVPTLRRTAAPAPVVGDRSFGELAFVGREAELARLRAAVAGRGVVTVAGPAGVGKSRLVAELVRHAGLPVLAARAFRPERAEAWGLARSLLREALATDSAVADALPPRTRAALAGLLPELGAAGTLDGESARALVLAGALRLVEAATGDGALLVADDLQWADPSSLALLASLLARLPRLAAVLAFRPDEPGTDEPRSDAPGPGTRGSDARGSDARGSDALAELVRARPGVGIELGPLPADAVALLVGDPDLTRSVLDVTDRTPFAVAELVRELAARGVLATRAGGGWTPRSPEAVDLAAELGRAGQRRAVLRRAERRTGTQREVLTVLALLAREAPAGTVAAVCRLDGRAAVDALSALAASGLARLGEQGWATAHDLVTETVTAGLGDGQRGRLHGLLAAALDTADADPSEIARHHREAGDAAAAARTFVRAADRALAAHATREARSLADAGLALRPRAGVRADLLAIRADAGAAHGDPAAATDLREALAGTPSGPDRARRLARLAMLTFGAQDPHRAAELAELALVEAAGDDPARAVALETASILDMNLERHDRARDRADAALALFRQLGDGRGVARILDGRAMATFLDGRIGEAVAVFGRVAQLFADSGELLRVVTPRSTRGHGLVFGGRPADGLAETTAALQLARDLDAPEGQAYALWHRSEALSGLGRCAEAEADAREALRIARAVGHRGWTATAHRALGIALQTGGRLDDAARAFADSAATAGDGLGLFASWAAARSALVALGRGDPAAAERLVDRALAAGPPLGHYEARLARAELAAARADGRCAGIAAAALRRARAGGHAVSVPRLAELAARAAG